MKTTVTLLLITVLSFPLLFSQNLIQDINTTGTEASSSPEGFIAFKNGFLFTASTIENGRELWWSDGTPNGISLVKDIFPGSGSGIDETSLIKAIQIEDTAYFLANDGEWGKQIWRTDGTEAGTYRISKFQEIANTFSVPLVEYKDEIYLAFTKPGTEYKQIWKGNGQVENFQIVKDSIPSRSEITSLHNVGDFIYFTNPFSNGNRELWRSDGTSQGTYSIHLTSFGGYSHYIEYQNKTYLIVGLSNDRDLYETDGTSAGTQQIANLSFSSGSIGGGHAQIANGKMYFSFYSDEDFYLFESDGTSLGTSLVVDLYGLSYVVPSNMKAFNDYLYFTGPLNSGTGLFRYNTQLGQNETILHFSALDGVQEGDAYGRVRFNENSNGLISVSIPPIIIIFPNFYSSAARFWITDGTSAGTFDLGLDLGSPFIITLGDKFFFGSGESYENVELYESDGTVAGTSLFGNLDKSINSVGNNQELFTLNEKVFVTVDDGVHDSEFWRTDGTSQGTYLLREIDTARSTLFTADFAKLNGKVFFSALYNNAYELWTTDGTSAGTDLLIDLVSTVQPNLPSSLPRHMARLGNHIYFVAHRDAELWRTDGTVQGTEFLTFFDSTGTGPNPYGIRGMIEVNGELFINASDYNGNLGTHALFKSDGTPGNKQLISNIRRIDNPSVKAGNLVYFIGEDTVFGKEVWRSDGTSAGTFAVKDVYQGIPPIPRYEFEPQGLMSLNNNDLIFFQDDGVNGRELWKTDGTTAGTNLVLDIFPGATSGIVRDRLFETAKMKDHIFFTAKESNNGTELWKTDGTPGGTQIVSDIQPGERGSLPHNFWVDDSTLYFAAYEEATGVELWYTDGTSAGTKRLTDINPGKGNSNPEILGKSGTRLIMSAIDGNYGWELWIFDLTTGITKPLLDHPSITIYPNPTVDQLHIQWEKPQIGPVEVNIRNLEGKLVVNRKTQVSSESFDYSLSVGELSSGTYILELKTNDSHLVKKFVKN